MRHIPWTSIENFHNVRRNMRLVDVADKIGVITYRAKVKLHGTNGGIAITTDGDVHGFSRNAVLAQKSDNAGFYAWVQTQRDAWSALRRQDGTLVIYGEWCGRGIQKGTAVNSLDRRIFAVFAARVVDDMNNDIEFIIEPAALTALVSGIQDVHVIPWYEGVRSIDIDMSAPGDVTEPALDVLNEHVLQVEACDPWISATFGIDGVGEGLVFYPTSENHTDHEHFSRLGFKAKGEKHRVLAQKKAVQANPPNVSGIASFVDLVITTARLEQGACEVAGGELTFDIKSMGNFLRWIAGDVTKETNAEIEASGFTSKTLVQACCSRARDWYIARC